MEITEEQKQKIKEFYTENTKYARLGERFDQGVEWGADSILEILGIEIEGVNV